MQRQALSLRGIAREYGFDRTFLAELVRRGELPALRRGRALLVLRADFESWFRAQARRTLKVDADARVRQVLDRQGRA